MNFQDWFVLDFLVKDKAKLKALLSRFEAGEESFNPKLILDAHFATQDLSKNYYFANIAEANLEYNGLEAITLESSLYPERLKQISDPPSILYSTKSDCSLNGKLVAMVGSRRASKYSLEFARRVAQYFAQKGVIVVSGMALGADKAAQQAVLDEQGKTIAVLGESLLYQKRSKANRGMINQIVSKGGCVLSEVPPWKNLGPAARNLVKRNRIISALADAVIIVECGDKSGTLHTINYAREQEKNIYLLEPHPTNSNHYDFLESLLSGGIEKLNRSNFDQHFSQFYKK